MILASHKTLIFCFPRSPRNWRASEIVTKRFLLFSALGNREKDWRSRRRRKTNFQQLSFPAIVRTETLPSFSQSLSLCIPQNQLASATKTMPLCVYMWMAMPCQDLGSKPSSYADEEERWLERGRSIGGREWIFGWLNALRTERGLNNNSFSSFPMN